MGKSRGNQNFTELKWNPELKWTALKWEPELKWTALKWDRELKWAALEWDPELKWNALTWDPELKWTALKWDPELKRTALKWDPGLKWTAPQQWDLHDNIYYLVPGICLSHWCKPCVTRFASPRPTRVTHTPIGYLVAPILRSIPLTSSTHGRWECGVLATLRFRAVPQKNQFFYMRC